MLTVTLEETGQSFSWYIINHAACSVSYIYLLEIRYV